MDLDKLKDLIVELIAQTEDTQLLDLILKILLVER